MAASSPLPPRRTSKTKKGRVVTLRDVADDSDNEDAKPAAKGPTTKGRRLCGSSRRRSRLVPDSPPVDEESEESLSQRFHQGMNMGSKSTKEGGGSDDSNGGSDDDFDDTDSDEDSDSGNDCSAGHTEDVGHDDNSLEDSISSSSSFSENDDDYEFDGDECSMEDDDKVVSVRNAARNTRNQSPSTRYSGQNGMVVR